MGRATIVTAVLAGLALTLPVAAQRGRQDLQVGDAAPGVSVDAWIEGGELKIEQGTVYVVLFFETASSMGQSSGATLRAFRELGGLWERSLGRTVRVLVISPEGADQVGNAIKDYRQVEGLSVAADRRSATWRAWVDKAGLRSYPAVFVVNRDSRIAYIGAPTDEGFTGVLAKVIEGRHDPKLQKQADPILEQARRARKVKNWRMATQLYDQVIALSPRVFADVAIEKFEMYLGSEHMADRDAGYTYARELIAGGFADDAPALRALAYRIARSPHIADADRDLDVALAAAEKALAVTGGDDPVSLSTEALVRFQRGEVGEAVALQTRAYFIAIPAEKPALLRDLRRYQEAVRAGG